MKRVIINADDFGLSKGINEGIVKAHREGVLTSATIMVNMPGFEQAVEQALKMPSLGIGIHLNVVRGRPVLSPERIPSLVDREGRFWGDLSLIIKKIGKKEIKIEEIISEFRAQINKALKAGLSLTHVDSEKHLHCFYPILKRLIPLLKDFGLQRIRYINQICGLRNPALFLGSVVVFFSWMRCRKMAQREGFRLTDNFFGLCSVGKMSVERIKEILVNLPSGTSEIMVHPGFITPEMVEIEKESGAYRLQLGRELELSALIAPELTVIIKRNNIELINFAQI
jgi:hopanoid biosynthesis associated protein HpnK